MEKVIKKKIILIGGGGHCKACIDIIERFPEFQIYGVLDNKLSIGSKILDYEVIGNDIDLPNIKKEIDYAFITFGSIYDLKIRTEKFNLLKEYNFILPKFIGSNSYISKYSSLDEGTIIMNNCIINTNTKIGKNCIVNNNSLVDHDSIIEDGCHISTSVTINGNCQIGRNTFIGTSSTILNNAKIQKDSFIKANTLT